MCPKHVTSKEDDASTSASEPTTDACRDKAIVSPGALASRHGRDAPSFFNPTRPQEPTFPTQLLYTGWDLLRDVIDGNVTRVMEMLSKYPELIDRYYSATDNSRYIYRHGNALDLALQIPERSDLALSIYEMLSKVFVSDEIRLSSLTDVFQYGFREYVAKGNQDAAEMILKQHPEFLKFGGAFTDYSGRTFNCHPYEYAYWAKDSHMCRMLEKYMDNDDKAEMLKRIKIIESPDGGLNYTQRGQTFRSAHFDLTPLKNALQHYVTEYNKKPDKTEADWDLLDKIWLKEVGAAQRDVPAHIAQEYCHPARSFEDVTRDKSLLDADNPANLKRCLKFVSNWGRSQDLWFFPGNYPTNPDLGCLYAIYRGIYTEAARSSYIIGPAREASIDLQAIKAIEVARTEDLQRTVAYLHQPVVVQSFQSCGIF